MHPIQPSAMDINKIKAEYGDRGVHDRQHRPRLHADAAARPRRWTAEVKERIEKSSGKGGGYMISSANSLTDYCKVDNVRAMSQAVKKYGKY